MSVRMIRPVGPAIELAVTREELERPVIVYLCRDGTITFRVKGERAPKSYKHAMPVFGVHTTDDAKQLQVRFGRLAHDNVRYLYSRDDFSGRYEEMANVTRAFREHYIRMQARQRERERQYEKGVSR